MFILLTKHDNRAVDQYLSSLSKKGYDVFVPLTYEALCLIDTMPALPVIFTEPERLDDQEGRAARALFDAAKNGKSGRNTLNDPSWTMGRYELLRVLHAKGHNDFNVHLVTEILENIKYPVFIRKTRRHGAILTGLLPDAAALSHAIETLVSRGICRAELLIVEYLDYETEGRFVKYGAYRIGTQIIPAMRIEAADWEVRDIAEDRSQTEIVLETEYIAANPHRDALLTITDLARVTYGRIDYAVIDGRIQVFEINTNPTVPPRETRDAFFAALALLDDGQMHDRRTFQDSGLKTAGRTLLERLFFGLSYLCRILGPRLSRRADRFLFAAEKRIILVAGQLRKRLVGSNQAPVS